MRSQIALSLAIGIGIGWWLVVAGTAPIQSSVDPVQASPVDGAPTDQISNDTESEPHIVDVYPNPVTYGDPGEFVTVSFPPGSNATTFALEDDHATVAIEPAEDGPSVQEGATVTFSTAPNITANLTDRTVRPLSDRIQLADAGDTIRLLANGSVIDDVSYGYAPEARVYETAPEDWRPLGATEKSIVSDGSGTVEAFVLPDEPDRARHLLDNATERILLAGYEISSPEIVDVLVAAHDRGVDVEVLADGSPVGGKGASAAAALDTLERAGIPVRVIGGDRDRYRFHHAKYAIVDDAALVTTENWKPAGVGGLSSRGWAVITNQSAIVDGLEAVYRADTGWVDAIPWAEYDPTLVQDEAATGDHPREFDAASVPVEATELLVAPDNADRRILDLIDGADHSIDVKQVHVGDRGFPFLQALLAAAERGVEVRLLLSSEWYVEEENEALRDWLEEQATAADLPLAVRLADPDGEFEKIHAKGMIVDGETVLVGSINWTNNSIQNNREVALLLHGEEVAGYYSGVFDADWSDDDEDERPIPVVLVGLAVLGATGSTIVAARVVQSGTAPGDWTPSWLES